MKNLYIMSGVSGSGKSFFAEMFSKQFDCHIHSTDNLWYKDGIYKFDYKLLGKKHKENQFLVEQDMLDDAENIIVDNTNITQKQAQPYINLAKKYGYNVTVIRITTPLNICIERNSKRSKNRQVPEEVIRNQFKNLENIIV